MTPPGSPRGRRGRRGFGALLVLLGLALGIATLAGIPAGAGAATGTGTAAAAAVGVPGAPTGVTVSLPVDSTLVQGSAVGAIEPDTATVSWSAPASDDGSAITGYTVTPYDQTAGSTGTPVTVGASTTTAVVTGLTTNHDYTFSVVATNASGQGPAGAAPQEVVSTKYFTGAISPAQDLTDGQTMTVTVTRTVLGAAEGFEASNATSGWCNPGTEQQGDDVTISSEGDTVFPYQFGDSCASQDPGEDGGLAYAQYPLNSDLTWPGPLQAPCPAGLTQISCDTANFPSFTANTIAQTGEVQTADTLVECDASTPCDFALSVTAGQGITNTANDVLLLFPVTFLPSSATAACGGTAANSLTSYSPDRTNWAWINWTLGACAAGVGGGQAPTNNLEGDEAAGIEAFATGNADLAYSAVGYGASGFTPTVQRPYVAVPIALNAAEFAAGPQYDQLGPTVGSSGVFSDYPAGLTLTIQEATQLLSGDVGGEGPNSLGQGLEGPGSGIIASLRAQDPVLDQALIGAQDFAGLSLGETSAGYQVNADAVADATNLFTTTFLDTLDGLDWRTAGTPTVPSAPLAVTGQFAGDSPLPNVNAVSGIPNFQKAVAPNPANVPSNLFALTDAATADATWGGLAPFALQAPDSSDSDPTYVLPTQSAMDAAVAQMTPESDGTLLPNPNTSKNSAGVEPYPLTFVEYALVPSQPYTNADCTVDTGKQQLLTQWLDYITGSQGQAELPAGMQSIDGVPLPSGADTYGQSGETTLDEQAAAAISTVGSAAVTGSCATPGAPTGVSGAAATDGSVELTWSAPTTTSSGAAGDGTSDGNPTPVSDYKIIATPAAGSATTIDTAATTTSYTITGLTPGTAYTFQVQAVNQGVTGPLSRQSASVTLPRGSTLVTVAPPPKGLPAADYGTPKSATVVAGKATTITLKTGRATAKVTVPAGALPAGTIVSVYPVKRASDLTSELPSTFTALAGFAVTWIAPDGGSPDASSPIKVTIADSAIKSGDAVYQNATTKLATVKTTGSAAVSFTADPLLILAEPKSVTATATSTTPLSGTGQQTGATGVTNTTGIATSPSATRANQPAAVLATKLPRFTGGAAASLARPLLAGVALVLLLGGVAFGTSGGTIPIGDAIRRLRRPRRQRPQVGS